MRRYVTLPAIGRRVSLGAYVAAVRAAKAHPEIEFKHGLSSWWPTKGSEIVRQFRVGMVERINEGTPASERGRK
jgi:hypothetical protein